MMKVTRKPSRRSFLALVVGAASFAGHPPGEPTDTAPLPRENIVSDSDTGAGADPPGQPRRLPRPPVRDQDSGPRADVAGCCGRRRRRTGITDSDRGAGADPANYGRGTPGCSDADSGAQGDPAGRGRRCTPR